MEINKVPTTTVVEDGKVDTVSFTNESVNKYAIINQSMADFLAKPYLYHQGSWTTAQAANTNLSTFSTKTAIAANAFWVDKLEGFNLYRGTAVVRVQINANPFQQGRLLLRFLPCALETSAASTPYGNYSNTNLALKTQHPNVELDAHHSSCVLEIPYVTPTSWYSKSTGSYDWGVFSLDVLSPLRTGSSGETTVDFSIWVSFKDFEMAAPIVPQSSLSTKKRYKATSIRQEERQANKVGVSEGILLSTKSLADSMSRIPLLKPITEPASWIMGALATTAGYLGYSKPVSQEPSQFMVQQYQRYGAVSNGVSPAIPLSLISDNSLTLDTQNSIRDVDEMSFAFLKGVPSMIYTGTWTTSQASGTTLYQKQITPSTLYQSGTKVQSGHTLTYGVGPPIFYLAGCFSYWRGCVKLTIRIPKTAFHTGRLQITWTPTSGSVVAPTLATGNVALREIIDLKDGDEFTLDLPYLLDVNYLPIASYSGQIDIIVLNELRGPETASSTLDLLFYYSGGDDFEFSMPIGAYGSQGQNISLQSLIDEVIGNEPCAPLDTTFSQMSIGEHFLNLRQLITRQMKIWSVSTLSEGTLMTVWPFMNPISYMSGGLITGPTVGGHLLSYLMPMYAFYRGGVEVTIGNENTSNHSTGFATCLAYRSGNTINISSATTSSVGEGIYDWHTSTVLTSGVAVQSDLGFITASVPYMAATKCSLVIPQDSDATPNERSQPLTAVAFGNASVTHFPTPWVNVKDDFQLSYFIGCPPKIINYV